MEGWLDSWVSATSALWAYGGRHLVQATLFSGLLFGVVLLLTRGPARLRHSLCLVASLKFLIPSAALFAMAALFRVDLGVLSSALHGLLEGPFGDWVYWLLVGGSRSAETASTASLPVAALVSFWLAGAAFLLLRWSRDHRRFARAVRAGHRLTTGREIEILERQRARLGLRRTVRLIVSAELPEPGAWGLVRPAVVLPEGVAEQLTAAELEAVILHELIHVQRWDNLIALLQRGLCCLFWFHPLLWLLDRRLLIERERVCDERVVVLSGASEPYARGLLKVLRFGVGLRLAGVSAATASNLRARIEHIQTGARRRGWPRLVQTALIAAGLGLFVLVSVLAQQPQPCSQSTDGKNWEDQIWEDRAPIEKAAVTDGSACPKSQKAV